MTDITPSEVEEATQGRYEVLSLLAEGGMGAVFLARHKELGSRVAIKILPPDVRFSPSRLARFRREASLSAQMSHPHLVPTIECSVEGDLAYLVMPYVDGVPLDAYLEQSGPMSYDELKKLITQIGSALTFAHNRGIVHRDIKPANILFEKDTERWLLTDFGVAHVTTEASALTQSGASLGTPAYMAPEQLGGAADVDGRADLYSLAAVAVEALTGSRPQPMAGVTEIADAVAHALPELPPGIARTLTAPLAVARDQRPDTIEDWLNGLDHRERSKPLMVGAGGAAALLLGWAAFALFSGGGGAAPADSKPMLVVLPFAVSGADAGIDLDSVLPQAFTWQLQTLPDYRIIQPSAVRSPPIVRRFGKGPYGPDTLVAVAEAVRADQALMGTVDMSDGTLTIRVQVYDVTDHEIIAGATAVGPPDSLHALVSQLVIDAFASRLARQLTGWRPSLPRGLPAVTAYFEGDRAFRRGAYAQAIERFDRVIQIDSSYAPAYLKRMLALVLEVEPTRTGPALRSALDAAIRYRSTLDPVSARLLEGYEILLTQGDIHRTEQVFQQVVDEHPDAVDVWFSLGLLRLKFASLMGSTIPAARGAFQQAVTRDPSFAAAIAQLAIIAVLEDDDATAQRYMADYLALDSTSSTAEFVRVADTLLYRQEHAARILASFPSRSSRVLENIAIPAGELRQLGNGTRPFATAAIEALMNRAATPEELTITFRMRMSVHLGSGRIAQARELIREGPRRGVPRDEIDRWIVLSAATGLEEPLAPNETALAASRLVRADDEPFVSAWVAARWARLAGVDKTIYERRLADLAASDIELTPIEQSLLDDLEALDYLAAGDTAQAIASWRSATLRFAIDGVTFGLVNSLWPLRLALGRAALATGDAALALEEAGTFGRMAGFVDQAAWLPAMTLQAEAGLAMGDVNLAINAYADMHRILGFAGEERAAQRDSIARLILELRN